MMGLHHGLYCLGCCWLLMALLFVLGIMNLPWIAVLTVLVLLEKILPRGRLSGVVFAAWGMWPCSPLASAEAQRASQL